MTGQGYNYLDRSFQEMSDFFETRVKNLETPASPPAVRLLPRKKEKKTSKRRKASSHDDSDEDASEVENPPSRKKFRPYHGKCSHSMDKCTTLKVQIKNIQIQISKVCRTGGEKMYTKHYVIVLIQKKLKKAFKGRKTVSKNYLLLIK